MSTKDGFPRWVVDACSTLDIGITVFAGFWFLIRGFYGIISFTLQLFNFNIYMQASCCYKAKC